MSKGKSGGRLGSWQRLAKWNFDLKEQVMGPVLLLIYSVSLGAVLGAFFLCGFCLSRYFYSLAMPDRLLKGSGRADVFGAIWRKINK